MEVPELDRGHLPQFMECGVCLTLPCITTETHAHCSQLCRMRKDEIASLSGPDEFGEFYRRLKSLKDFHRRHPNQLEEPMAMEFLRLDKQRNHPPDNLQMQVDFSDEEGYGKYLDMHVLHDSFINLRQMEVSSG